MKTLLARECGFCKGVSRAVDKARNLAGECGPVRTYGPLVHNKGVVADLEAAGVRAVGEIEKGDGTPLLIRSHGVPPDERKKLLSLGIRVEDATCPDVGHIHSIAKGRAAKGYMVIVLGDPGHAEVKGILGCAGQAGVFVEKPSDVDNLEIEEGRPVCLVSQSTQEVEAFDETARRLLARRADAEIRDTVCSSTKNRQAEARRLAREAPAVVVVGGRHSANTTRLAEVVREEGARAVHIENASELDPAELAKCTVVGLTAGASTPPEEIEAVRRLLESLPPG